MKRAHWALACGWERTASISSSGRLAGDQAVPDREVVLADQGDVVRVEGEGVEGGGDGSLDGVLERDQGAVRLSLANGEDRVVDRRRGGGIDIRVSDRSSQGILAEGPLSGPGTRSAP